jgi:hypothetical protein
MNVEAEIRDFKRRVSELEGSCGEGAFGFLAHQISTLHKDLLAFQGTTEQHFDKVESRLDKLDGRPAKVNSRLDDFDRGLRELTTDVTKIIADSMREVLGGSSRKKL